MLDSCPFSWSSSRHEPEGRKASCLSPPLTREQNTDDNGHGTHTAATAAGDTVGVDNTTIPVAVKCLDRNSQGTWSGVMAAIDWGMYYPSCPLTYIARPLVSPTAPY